MSTTIRQPIVVVLGHVDHGKTTLLDRIRGTSVADREPGQITQWIGASLIPAQTVLKICGPLLERFGFKIEVPGLLFIDTPGHETFSNLRRRGGSAADVAILVVDLTKGIEPQTVESMNILKARRTPFLVCANKVDAVPGWKSLRSGSFLQNLRNQRPEVVTDLDNRLYTMMGAFSRYGLATDRFDRIRDFTKTIALVPASAKTGEGLPELLSVLVGLTQGFMKKKLVIEKRIREEVETVKVTTDRVGIIVKADALGSLEALTTSLAAANVPVRIADVGDVSRRDIVEATVVKSKDPYLAAIIAFNVKMLPDAEEEATATSIPIFRGNIIYHVLEDYSRWVTAQRSAGVKAEMDLLIRPGKIRILRGKWFRRNDPSIVGVEILEGVVRPKYPLVNEDRKRIGTIVHVQDQGKDVPEAGVGKQVAVSIDKPTVGRHIFEGEVLYVDVPPQHVKILSSKFKDYLSPGEVALLSEIMGLGKQSTMVG